MKQENNIFTKENTSHTKVGERRIMNDGSLAEIIVYNNNIDIYVQFPPSKYCETSNIKHTTYHHFCKGLVKNNYAPSILNIACKGDTETTDENGNKLTSYTLWCQMIARCYKTNLPTYEKVAVCDEWLCYMNFKKWFNDNYYTIENERVDLDKDIMKYGNKTYSPDSCIFVPTTINQLFKTRKQVKNIYLPIGVSFDEKRNKFTSSGQKGLKSFDTFDDVINYYIKSKECQIKSLANKYKNKIPKRLYDRLMEYKVQIEYPQF